MKLNEIYKELEELQAKYTKTVNVLTTLSNKVAKLEKENKQLREENESLKKQVRILKRAIEIALKIQDYRSQTRHLSTVLQKFRELYGDEE